MTSLFVLNVPVCHKCQHHVKGRCGRDGVAINTHAREGFCPASKFQVNAVRPDTWDKHDVNLNGIPFTPETPPEQVLQHIEKWNPHRDIWARWSNVQEAYRNGLRSCKDNVPPMPGMEGRGIVILGAGLYFPSAYVTIRVIRSLGCTLPIELWHLPNELPAWQRKALDGFGVEFRNVGDIAARTYGGWESKSLAIHHSRFAEVLFLDADCYPCIDPTFLFDADEYVDHGLVFWSDRPRQEFGDGSPGDKLSKRAFEILGIPYRDEWTKEAGQLLIDKRRHWNTLIVAEWLNQHSDYYYQPNGLLYGDKDTLWLAALYLNESYYYVPRQWDGAPPAIVQPRLDGDLPLFIHRCNGKFSFDHGMRGAFERTEQFPENRNDKLPLEDECFSFLAALKEQRPKITALTVCIDYGDYLAKTVEQNKLHFDEWIVVTSKGDIETQEICKKHGLTVLLSENKNLNGSKFNLGALRNEGYDAIKEGWICSIDADCIMPQHLRARLDAYRLDESKIYGVKRQGNSSERGDKLISGFFQLFHSSTPHRYDEHHKDAGETDITFRDQWNKADQITIDGLVCQHLATTGVDWSGRVSPRLDAPRKVAPTLPTTSQRKCGGCSRNRG